MDRTHIGAVLCLLVAREGGGPIGGARSVLKEVFSRLQTASEGMQSRERGGGKVVFHNDVVLSTRSWAVFCCIYLFIFACFFLYTIGTEEAQFFRLSPLLFPFLGGLPFR